MLFQALGTQASKQLLSVIAESDECHQNRNMGLERVVGTAWVVRERCIRGGVVGWALNGKKGHSRQTRLQGQRPWGRNRPHKSLRGSGSVPKRVQQVLGPQPSAVPPGPRASWRQEKEEERAGMPGTLRFLDPEPLSGVGRVNGELEGLGLANREKGK